MDWNAQMPSLSDMKFVRQRTRHAECEWACVCEKKRKSIWKVVWNTSGSYWVRKLFQLFGHSICKANNVLQLYFSGCWTLCEFIASKNMHRNVLSNWILIIKMDIHNIWNRISQNCPSNVDKQMVWNGWTDGRFGCSHSCCILFECKCCCELVTFFHVVKVVDGCSFFYYFLFLFEFWR